MAIYEYDCPQCGTFEVMQKMSDPALTSHDVCGQPVQRRISLTSFALKGSGWYSDGYSTSKPAPANSDAAAKPEAPKKDAAAPCGAPSGTCGTGTCAAA